MNFSDEFSDLLKDTCSWKQKLSRSRTGVVTYAAGISYYCRLVQKTRLVRDINGDQVVSTANLVIGKRVDGTNALPPNVNPEDQILLSTGATPLILMVERPQDETGNAAFTKIYFK